MSSVTWFPAGARANRLAGMVLHGNGLDHEAELIVNPVKHTISGDVKEKRHEKVLAGCRGWYRYVLAGCRGWHRYSVQPHSHLSERTRDGQRGHIGRSRGLALDQPPLASAILPDRSVCRFCSAGGGSCAGFRTPELRNHPRARTAGGRKAPRHEIAGCGAPTVQRALWGFGADVSVGEADPSLSIWWFWVEALACVLVRTSGSQVARQDLRCGHGPILRTGASGGAAGRDAAIMACFGAVSDRQ